MSSATCGASLSLIDHIVAIMPRYPAMNMPAARCTDSSVNPLVSHRGLTRGKKGKVGLRESMPGDLGELENPIVRTLVTLQRLNGFSFSMAHHVNPIRVSLFFKLTKLTPLARFCAGLASPSVWGISVAYGVEGWATVRIVKSSPTLGVDGSIMAASVGV